MKIVDYMVKEVKNGKRNFDIGFWPNMEVDNNSPNRIKFKIDV